MVYRIYLLLVTYFLTSSAFLSYHYIINRRILQYPMTMHSFAIKVTRKVMITSYYRISYAMSMTTTSTAPISSSTISASKQAFNVKELPTVILEKGKARLFQDGNPIIYGGAVKEIKGSPEMCDEVLVTDHFGNDIGRGVFNPTSTYRVRLLARNYEPEFIQTLPEILKTRIFDAKMLRQTIGIPQKEYNTVYRLVNGEGDRLGGLVVDVLGNSIIIQSSACWVERYKENIIDAVDTVMNDPYNMHSKAYKIIWRQVEARLKQDGYIYNTSVTDSDDSSSQDKLREDIIYENGIKYVVYPESNGQKTGFFCDQRDNRRVLGSVAKGKTVLDCYSYSGGFTLAALLNGATSVESVDSSQVAIDLLERNIDLNKDVIIKRSYEHEDKIPITAIKADAVDHMKQLLAMERSYDIVITDPPKLAPTRNSLDRAREKYIKINTNAMLLVKPGGLLFTFTCSAAVTQSQGEFLRVLSEAAKNARRDLTILSITSAAADHPVHIGSPGGYLTGVLVRVK